VECLARAIPFPVSQTGAALDILLSSIPRVVFRPNKLLHLLEGLVVVVTLADPFPFSSCCPESGCPFWVTLPATGPGGLFWTVANSGPFRFLLFG